MADVFSLSTYSDVAGWSDGTSKDTGDLRRKYNFGDRVSELNIAQDPFFRFVSKVAKQPTDDPEFKFTERRGSYHKRYAYITAHGPDISVSDTGDATVNAGYLNQGDTYYLKMGTDYESAGNIGNVSGQSSGAIAVGAANTAPQFFLENQIIKINTRAEDEGTDFTIPTGYVLAKVKGTPTAVSTTHQILQVEIVKGEDAAKDLMWESASAAVSTTYNKTIATDLEPKRCYVVGSAHGQGTGYPETWKDQPFSTGFGLTQIWKTAMAMDNTTRATVLKYEPNEFARIWREKLIEHKWDIEQSLLFGAQGTVDSVQYTEGAVDFIISYGNIFSGTGMSATATTKSQDDFLDDMSQFLDPRYNNANATLFMVPTDTYNWLHKLGGYFAANVAQAEGGQTNFQVGGKKNVFGVDIRQILTPYGNMNVSRNVHLDGTQIKMLGVNMKYCKYRPLVGNGLNRDTAVYVGVQTLENSGVDRRVDLIQTEAGMEWQMPEAHAVWKV
jgi:hypothetical protein